MNTLDVFDFKKASFYLKTRRKIHAAIEITFGYSENKFIF